LLTKVNRVYEEESKNLGRQVESSCNYRRENVQEKDAFVEKSRKHDLEGSSRFQRRPSVPSGGSTTEDSSVYSADEGSPPLVNGKSLHKNHAAPVDTSARITQTSPPNTAVAASAPSAPQVLARNAIYGKASLRLPSPFKKRSTFRDDTFQGAYTNPNVRKLIDVQYDAND
ncbi:hypothetical protein COOONC_17489, partial [Cooperia oncophora]